MLEKASKESGMMLNEVRMGKYELPVEDSIPRLKFTSWWRTNTVGRKGRVVQSASREIFPLDGNVADRFILTVSGWRRWTRRSFVHSFLFSVSVDTWQMKVM